MDSLAYWTVPSGLLSARAFVGQLSLAWRSRVWEREIMKTKYAFSIAAYDTSAHELMSGVGTCDAASVAEATGVAYLSACKAYPGCVLAVKAMEIESASPAGDDD